MSQQFVTADTRKYHLFVIGVLQSSLGAMNSLAQYRTSTPFVVAIVVLLYFGWRGDTEGRVA